MTYNEKSIIFNNKSFTANFSVTMYINELETDEYSETYNFFCDEFGILKIILLDGESENILKSEDSSIKKELREYGEDLCSRIHK